MTVEFDDFLPGITPQVPSCPNAIAINAVRNASIRFCDFTRYWQQALVAIDSVADQQTYTLVPPLNANIAGMIGITFDGKKINEAGGQATAVQRAVSGSDAVSYFVEVGGGSYLLRPYPTVDRVLVAAFVVTVALKPTQAATGVDDRVYIDHQETIVAGALERLLKMRGKDWYEPGLATDYGYDFRRGNAAARIHVNKGFSNQSLRVVQRPFA